METYPKQSFELVLYKEVLVFYLLQASQTPASKQQNNTSYCESSSANENNWWS